MNPKKSIRKKLEDLGLVEAEVWLIRALVELIIYKKECRQNWSKTLEREYKELKSIARSLYIFPVPDWAWNYSRVLHRIEGPVLNLKQTDQVVTEFEYHKPDWHP